MYDLRNTRTMTFVIKRGYKQSKTLYNHESY